MLLDFLACLLIKNILFLFGDGYLLITVNIHVYICLYIIDLCWYILEEKLLQNKSYFLW